MGAQAREEVVVVVVEVVQEQEQRQTLLAVEVEVEEVLLPHVLVAMAVEVAVHRAPLPLHRFWTATRRIAQWQSLACPCEFALLFVQKTQTARVPFGGCQPPPRCCRRCFRRLASLRRWSLRLLVGVG